MMQREDEFNPVTQIDDPLPDWKGTLLQILKAIGIVLIGLAIYGYIVGSAYNEGRERERREIRQTVP